MKTHKFKYLGFLLILGAMVLGSAFCLTGLASADSAKPDYRLQVSPVQLGIGTLEPGETYTGSFEVQNTGNKAYDYKTEITPYSVSGLYYTQDFDTATSSTIITDWIEIVSGATGTVEPNSVSVVKYVIHVPDDAPAGTQSAAIMAVMDLDDDIDASAIKTVSRIAYYFYANIAGETRTTGEIVSNKVPRFSFAPTIVATSVVKNTGNIYTRAEYWLEVRNYFNNQIEYANTTYIEGEETPETRVIFPDSERYNEVSWDDAPTIGLFKVKSTVKIFDESSTVEKVVLICPLWLLVIVLLFVAVVVYWIVSRILKRRER